MGNYLKAAAGIALYALFIAAGIFGCHGLWLDLGDLHWAIKCLLMPWAFVMSGIFTFAVLFIALAPILMIFIGDESGGCDAAL